MAEEEKPTRNDPPFPDIDLTKDIVHDDEAGSALKALVPFDPLQRYLTEIRRFPLLSREEEHRLAVEYKEYGNLEAAYQLVTGNLRLVVMIAREYQKSLKNLLDLIQEGNMGLMEAVKNFDPYRGVRFPSYAVWWIRAYMIRYIMSDWRMVKIGTTQAQRKLFFNLQKEKEKLEAEGITPGPKLLAQRLNVKEDEVVEMEQRLGSRDLSVDVPIGDDDEATLLHFLPDHGQGPEEQFAETQSRKLLGEKMELFAKTLKDKELVIYRERLLNEEPLTLREIGEKYGISRERVRQIEERVKKKLKTYLSQELKDVKDVVGVG
ncbi:MAG TPA: RNA polymerase factor sigma-32 [Methylomirabilota bacterium]|nr:RNA polymerase factor sigma-32 [Methylomirabilota bacterium]